MINCKKALETVKALKPLCDEKCGEGDACSVACGQIDSVIELLTCLCAGKCSINSGGFVVRGKDRSRGSKKKDSECEGGVCDVPEE